MSNKKVRASDHESYTSYSILTILVPLVGFIIGIIFMVRDKKLDKQLGQHLLMTSILLSTVYWFAWIWWVGYQADQTAHQLQQQIQQEQQKIYNKYLDDVRDIYDY